MKATHDAQQREPLWIMTTDHATIAHALATHPCGCNDIAHYPDHGDHIPHTAPLRAGPPPTRPEGPYYDYYTPPTEGIYRCTDCLEALTRPDVRPWHPALRQ